MSRLHFHSLTVSQVIRECDDAVAVTFDVPEALRATYAYQPGQYLTLRQEIAGEEQHRSYSLCSSPLDGEWRIGIRELPGGVFSTWANRTLRAGMTVDCMPPDGRFCPALDATTAKHFVLIAVGSGITPCLSIAKAVLQSAPRSRVTLLYGNRRAASAMFREALEDLKNRYLDRFALYCVFSREASDVPLFEGRLDGAKVREFLACLVPAATIDEAFLCGPNAMLDAVERVLLDAGVPEACIHIERFGVGDLAMPVRTEIAVPSAASVTVVLDGQRREISLTAADESILEAAREAGLDLPFSCKSGVCATCRARVLEGEVHMARNFALMKSDLEAGIVLTCQSRPVTPRVVISFDER